MIPEPDPNKAIEDGLKADGEFLRDVDKGMSGTETSLGVDLGTVREDHTETIDSMQEVADSDTPATPEIQEHAPAELPPLRTAKDVRMESDPPESPSAPVVNIQQVQSEHSETIDQLGAISEETETAQPDESTPRQQRVSVPEIQQGHSEAIVQMGKVVQKDRTPDEKPTPLTLDPAELERLTFPGDQHQSEVKGSMENWIREQREWMAAVNDLFRLSAELHRQDRLELELIRGQLERIRL